MFIAGSRMGSGFGLFGFWGGGIYFLGMTIASFVFIVCGWIGKC